LTWLEKPDNPVLGFGYSGFISLRAEQRKEENMKNLKLKVIWSMENGDRGIKEPRLKKLKHEYEVVKTGPSSLVFQTIHFF
jgi:hypothetical protein